MHMPIPKRGDDELVNGIGDRFIAAFVVTAFATIPCVVLWMIFNGHFAVEGLFVSLRTLGWIIGGLALLAFLFPKVALDIMGKLWEFLHFLGTFWWWW